MIPSDNLHLSLALNFQKSNNGSAETFFNSRNKFPSLSLATTQLYGNLFSTWEDFAPVIKQSYNVTWGIFLEPIITVFGLLKMDNRVDKDKN